jgi:hypothetical protein
VIANLLCYYMQKHKMGNHNTGINRIQLRKRILAYAAATRAHPFTRVSASTMRQFEAMLEAGIRSHVEAAPSRGKTL